MLYKLSKLLSVIFALMGFVLFVSGTFLLLGWLFGYGIRFWDCVALVEVGTFNLIVSFFFWVASK